MAAAAELAGSAEGKAQLAKEAWGTALQRAKGDKVFDDPRLLKKSMKKVSWIVGGVDAGVAGMGVWVLSWTTLAARKSRKKVGGLGFRVLLEQMPGGGFGVAASACLLPVVFSCRDHRPLTPVPALTWRRPHPQPPV